MPIATTVRPTSSSLYDATYGTAAAVGAGSLHAAVADDTDASYVRFSTWGTGPPYYGLTGDVSFTFAATPAGSVITSATLRWRHRSVSVAGSTSNDSWMRCSFNIGGTGAGYADVPNGNVHFAGTTFGDVNGNPTRSTAFPAGGGVAPIAYFAARAGSLGVSGYQQDLAAVWLDYSYVTAPNAPTGLGAANTTSSLRPTLSWTHNGGASAGVQSQFQVKIFTAAQHGIGGFDVNTSPSTVNTTIASATSSYLLASDLVNGQQYYWYVRTASGDAAQNAHTTQGAWSASSNFTMAIPVPVPTAVTPANSAVSTTSRPAVGASVAAMSGGVQIKREWTIASNTGFSNDVTTIIDATLSSTKSGTVAFPALPSRLPQGTWYVRCRAVDSFGVTSAWTAINTFTVAHAPSSSNRQPSSGVALPYTTSPTVTWTFGDPDPEDYQTRYATELWKLSDPAGSLIQVPFPGSVISGVGSHAFTVDATWKATELRWRVRTTDQDSVEGAWSADQSFFLYDLPVGSLTFPAEAQVITSAQPTFTWTFAASDGRTQTSWRVIVTRVNDSTVIADSGTVSSAALSWQIPSPIILIDTNYSVTLTTTDSVGLVSTDTHAFTATYAAPTTPIFSLDTSNFYTDGVVFVDWTTSTVDGTNLGWKLLRRLAGSATWATVAETATAVKSYYDYLCPSATDVEYSVVQVAESFGDPVESAYPVEAFYGESEYAIVCPENPSLNLRLYTVTSDDFEDEQEMSTQNLIGRGRRVEYGTRFGQTGSLTADFRDQQGGPTARQQRLALEALRDSGLLIYLRTPFGDVWAVAAQSARIARVAGVGMQAMATATIAYTEITA